MTDVASLPAALTALVGRLRDGDWNMRTPEELAEAVADAIMEALAALASPAPSAGVVDETFDAEDNAHFIEHCAEKLARSGYRVTAGALRVIAAEYRSLSQHPAAPSVSPAYDRELIAGYLDTLLVFGGGIYEPEGIREQARLLREADNAEAANIRTVDRSPAVAGDGLPPEFVTCDDCGTPVEAHCPKCAAASSAPQGEAVATVSRKGNLAGSISWTRDGIDADLPDGTKLYTTPPPAPAAEQPQGEMVLVPREPTPKMVDATWNDPAEDANGGGLESHNTRNRRIYAAMLSAAPSRPVVDKAMVEKFCVTFLAGQFPTKATHNDNAIRAQVRNALTAALGQQEKPK